MSKGFTLIELLVVISIIGILSGLSLFGINMTKEDARDSVRKLNIEMIASALQFYKQDCGVYPTSFPQSGSPLVGNGSRPSCKLSNIYIASVPTDPQGPSRYYNYFSDGKTFEICASLERGTGTVSCGDSNICGTRIAKNQDESSNSALAQATKPPIDSTPLPPAPAGSDGYICNYKRISP